MRIAMLSTPYLPVPPTDYGGTELVVHELVEGLVERGHRVTLFATGDSRTSAELRWTCERAEWPPHPVSELTHVAWALEQVGAGSYDLVHAHSAFALAVRSPGPAVPLVYTIHHDRDEKLSRLYRRVPHVDYVAISRDQRAREVDLPRCTVIHHGLDPSRYRCARSSDDTLLFIGRFARVKGPHTAMDVARAAGRTIVLAGEVHDVDRAFGEREVRPRLSHPHVRPLGRIGMERKVRLLRDARALLAPIEWNEPFGLVLVEAMLSGCPVVAYPRGSVPELVESGVTGFVVRTAAEMAETVRPGGPVDSFDRRRCRRRAVERFGRDRMMRRYEALYGAILGRASAHRPAAAAGS